MPAAYMDCQHYVRASPTLKFANGLICCRLGKLNINHRQENVNTVTPYRLHLVLNLPTNVSVVLTAPPVTAVDLHLQTLTHKDRKTFCLTKGFICGSKPHLIMHYLQLVSQKKCLLSHKTFKFFLNKHPIENAF